MTTKRKRRNLDDGRDGTKGDVPGCLYPGLDKIATRDLDPSVNTIFFGGGWFALAHWIQWHGFQDAHLVYVAPFYISLKAVTEAQWGNLIKDFEPRYPDSTLHVKWLDAVRYCNLLSRKDKLEQCYTITENEVKCDWNANGYRLPTEAEWNYATPCYRRRIKKNLEKAPLALDKMFADVPISDTSRQDIISFSQYNWCWDFFDQDYYKKSPLIDPTGPDYGDKHVVRCYPWFSWPSNNSFKPYRFGYESDKKACFHVVRSWMFLADVRKNNQLSDIPQWDR